MNLIIYLYSGPVVQQEHQQVEKIRINLHKLQPEDLGMNMIIKAVSRIPQFGDMWM